MTPGPRCASVPDNKNILPTRAAAGSCSAAQSRHCSWEICLGTVIHTAVDTCTSQLQIIIGVLDYGTCQYFTT